MKKVILGGIREIFFIVVGIYLAFELSNWKENLDDKKLEKELIGNIKIGLQSDLNDIEDNLEAHSRFLQNQEKAIAWLQSDAPLNDSVTVYFSEAHYATSIMSMRAPFESLKEFGLNKISNDTLRNRIVFLYDVLYADYAKSHDRYHAILQHTLDVGLVHFEDWSFKKGERLMKPYNVKALRADRKYLMQLKLLKKQNELMLYHINMLHKRVSSLIKATEKHSIS